MYKKYIRFLNSIQIVHEHKKRYIKIVQRQHGGTQYEIKAKINLYRPKLKPLKAVKLYTIVLQEH